MPNETLYKLFLKLSDRVENRFSKPKRFDPKKHPDPFRFYVLNFLDFSKKNTFLSSKELGDSALNWFKDNSITEHTSYVQSFMRTLGSYLKTRGCERSQKWYGGTNHKVWLGVTWKTPQKQVKLATILERWADYFKPIKDVPDRFTGDPVEYFLKEFISYGNSYKFLEASDITDRLASWLETNMIRDIGLSRQGLGNRVGTYLRQDRKGYHSRIWLNGKHENVWYGLQWKTDGDIQKT